jgi:hypothetical protein
MVPSHAISSANQIRANPDDPIRMHQNTFSQLCRAVAIILRVLREFRTAYETYRKPYQYRKQPLGDLVTHLDVD